MNLKQLSGFTLLELLIALAIFAVISSITASGLYYAFKIQERVRKQASELNNIELAFSLLANDSKQIIARSVHDDQMRTFSSFIGTNQYMEFTRGGLVASNTLQNNSSSLQRVAWLCKDAKLIRRSWQNLDLPSHDSAYIDKVLLTNLAQCDFAYLDNKLQILSRWRGAVLAGKTAIVPRALRLTIDFNKKNVKISLLFSLPV